MLKYVFEFRAFKIWFNFKFCVTIYIQLWKGMFKAWTRYLCGLQSIRWRHVVFLSIITSFKFIMLLLSICLEEGSKFCYNKHFTKLQGRVPYCENRFSYTCRTSSVFSLSISAQSINYKTLSNAFKRSSTICNLV